MSAARWGVENEARIHYDETRPMKAIDSPFHLPLDTDCSGFVTLCYAWSGAPDPNGLDFDGYGYTGTLLKHMRHIRRSSAREADLVVWGRYPGHHVALVVEAAADPLLCSHGAERGPVEVSFSAESRFQPAPVAWLTVFRSA